MFKGLSTFSSATLRLKKLSWALLKVRNCPLHEKYRNNVTLVQSSFVFCGNSYLLLQIGKRRHDRNANVCMAGGAANYDMCMQSCAEQNPMWLVLTSNPLPDFGILLTLTTCKLPYMLKHSNTTMQQLYELKQHA